jgi:hypothetical protein
VNYAIVVSHFPHSLLQSYYKVVTSLALRHKTAFAVAKNRGYLENAKNPGRPLLIALDVAFYSLRS